MLDLARGHNGRRLTLARKLAGAGGSGSRFRGQTPVLLTLAALAAFLLAATGDVGAQGLTEAPGQSPPEASGLPSISGTYVEGKTVSADAGTWNGPEREYAFQWVHCDGSGAACAPIIAATESTYDVAAVDVRSTLRVAVTATNKNGSTVAMSDATPVIAPALSTLSYSSTSETTTTTTTTTSTTTSATTTSPGPGTGYYYSEHFDGAFNNSIWTVEAPSPSAFSWAPGFLNGAGRLTDCASTSRLCSTSSSTFGQLTAVWAGGAYAHAGYSGAYGGSEEETWYRFKLRLPADYQPTPGSQNTLFSFHIDGTTEGDARSIGQSAYSPALEVQSDGFSATTCPGSPYLCTTAGSNPRLMLRVTGGDTRSPDSDNVKYFQMPSNSLLRDHWYDIVLHFYWSASRGHVGWWVDGQKIVDVDTPTLYARTDGTSSFATTIGFYNYRLWATWPFSLDFDEAVWGPTSASVGFTP